MTGVPEKLALDGGTPVREERLPIFRLELGAEEEEAVLEVLRSGYISRGPRRTAFEEEFASKVGAARAVSVSSGTAALHLALDALELEPGDEVVVPGLTFVATAFAPEYCGLTPVLADIDPVTRNLCPRDLAAKVGPRTRAVIPVHFAGSTRGMDEIYEVAREHGLAVVEDAAHSVGGTLPDGMPVGGETALARGLRRLTAFSLFATKNMTAGEGGVVTTQDPELAARVERGRAHGIGPLPDSPQASGFYDVYTRGLNYHASDIHMALASVQLERLDGRNARRRELSRRLADELAPIPGIEVPEVHDGHACHLFNVYLEPKALRVDRDQVVRALLAEGVQVGLYYRPLHMFTYFRERYGTGPGLLPVTERETSRLVTLPLYPELSDGDVADIVSAVGKVVRFYRKKD